MELENDLLSTDDDELIPWEEIGKTENGSFFEWTERILGSLIRLPNHSVQSKIMTSCFLINSKACQTVPIIQLLGPSGSGKTTAAKLFNTIGGYDKNDMAIAGSSWKSIRNKVDSRIRDEVLQHSERHGHRLVIDNVYCSSFQDDEFYGMILTGFSRGAKLSIASKEAGETLDYSIYTLKLLTTIERLKSKYPELSTRLIELNLNTLDSLSDEDRGEGSVTEIDLIDFSGFFDSYCEQWDKTAIQKFKQGFKLARNLKIEARQLQVLGPAIATMKALSNYSDDEIKGIWREWIELKKKEGSKSTLALAIENWILTCPELTIERFTNGGKPGVILSSMLHDYLKQLVKEGQLQQIPRNISSVMAELGYEEIFLKVFQWRLIK